jgi:putative transposase
VSGLSRTWSALCLALRVFTGRPKHLKAFDYLGLYRYFLTFCTHQRRHVFVTSDRVELVRAQILRAATDQHFALLAYCFMPDHAHLLVEGLADDADCRRLIARAKQTSGFHYQKMFGARLWQRYGFERTLRRGESALSVGKYILENPVRAGLAKSVEEYPFLGSTTHTLAEILEAVQSRGSTWSG